MLHYLITGLLLGSGLVLFLTLSRDAFASPIQKSVLLGSACLFILVGALRLQAVGSQKLNPDTAAPVLSEFPQNMDSVGRDDLTFEEWQQLGASDQINRGRELLKKLRQEQLFLVSIRSEQEFTPWAVALQRCFLSSQSLPETAIQDLAVLCVEQDLQKYK